MIRILLADDHALVRKGVQLIISYEKDLSLVGEVADGQALISLVQEVDADLVVLDLEMPKMNGLTVIPKLRELNPDLKILVLSMHPEDLYGHTAKQLGVDGYLRKDEEPKSLIEAIRRVHKGEKVFSANLIKDKKTKKPIKLSRREVEVLRLLNQGFTNKEVAQELEISDKTVSTYKLRLLNKIGGKSLVDLIHFSKNYPEILDR